MNAQPFACQESTWCVLFESLQPWDYPIPRSRFKYFPPERTDVLVACRVRFSQRSVFDDDHELQLDVNTFGKLEEIWRFVLTEGLHLPPGIPAKVLVQLIAESPKAQATALNVARKNMKSVNQFGIFCLSEDFDSDQTWSEYAGDAKGFVPELATDNSAFEKLKTAGKLGKVTYSDEPYGTYLGMMENEGASFFFRKRTKYAFGREGRSIRALRNLDRHPGDVFVAPFDPACVRKIILRPGCTVETPLRNLVGGDNRYSHVELMVMPAS